MIETNNSTFSMPVMPAYCGGMGGFGGNDSLGWFFILFLYAMCNGGMGGFMNGRAMNNALTRGELCQDMNFQDVKNAVYNNGDNMQAGFRNVDNAICTLGYNNAQLANGMQMQIANEGRGIDNAICTLGYNVKQGQSDIARQMSDCCCDIKGIAKDGITQGIMNTSAIQSAIKDCCCENEKIAMQSRFDAQQNACNTLQAIDKLGDRIEARLTASEHERLIAENAAKDRQILALQFAASQGHQTADIRTGVVNDLRSCPVGTYNVPNPNCCYGPWGGMNWNGFVNGRECGCGM